MGRGSRYHRAHTHDAPQGIPIAMQPTTRREWLAAAPILLGAGAAAPSLRAEEAPMTAPGFRFALNTSTISGQKLTLVQELEIAAKAGYQGVEPWLREIEAHVQAGGSLADLKKRIADLGLAIPSAIGFAEWAVDDDARRAKGLEQMKRDMETVAAIGGTRIAAPPAGATDRADLDLAKVAGRYRAILEAGRAIGVVPMVEVWGFSKSISRLGEAAMVAIGADHPDACILADVYHLYRGGSGFEGIKLLNGRALPVLHMNDYPADPPRAEITDAQRVFPGAGVAPLPTILRDLRAIGFEGYLSLELFNREYWGRDAEAVAREGIDRMRTAVEAASKI